MLHKNTIFWAECVFTSLENRSYHNNFIAYSAHDRKTCYNPNYGHYYLQWLLRITDVSRNNYEILQKRETHMLNCWKCLWYRKSMNTICGEIVLAFLIVTIIDTDCHIFGKGFKPQFVACSDVLKQTRDTTILGQITQ